MPGRKIGTRLVTQKMLDAEKYVDEYIIKHGKPPSYQNVSDFFNLKKSDAAFSRLRRYRHKMKQKHGLTRKHPLYRVWCGMKERCYRINHKAFNRYGGRGITVCYKWRNDYLCFFKWATENGYIEGLELDRKNNNGNYTPKNCRFITTQAQQKNKSTNIVITYNGKTMIATDWAKEMGINPSTFLNRCRRTSDLETIFSKTKRKRT